MRRGWSMTSSTVSVTRTRDAQIIHLLGSDYYWNSYCGDYGWVRYLKQRKTVCRRFLWFRWEQKCGVAIGYVEKAYVPEHKPDEFQDVDGPEVLAVYKEDIAKWIADRLGDFPNLRIVIDDD